MDFRTADGPGVGLFPADTDCVVWNRTGATLVAGDVVMFDHADTQAETDTSLVWGADSSTLANVIDPTTAGIGAVSGDGGYWCGVTLPFQDGETGADNTKVHIRVMGICGVSITATAATIGVNLYPANGVNTLTVTQADGVRPLARLRQANGSAAGVYECIFDGIHGVGHAQSAS